VRWWSLCFVSFFGMVAAWSLALPVNGTYDEKQHIVRAYAVATGHLTPVGETTDALGRRTAVLLPIVAGRYSPVYYAAVGAPLALRPDRLGLGLTRVHVSGDAARAQRGTAHRTVRPVGLPRQPGDPPP
jgi:hypothetical protein